MPKIYDKKLKINLSIIILIIALLAFSVFSFSDLANEMKIKIALAEENALSLQNEGLQTVRYNDTLLLAKEYYKAAVEAEQNGQEQDYQSVKDKLNELSEIKSNAFKTLDELHALRLTIDQNNDINLTSVEEIYSRAEEELKNERYEKSLELIDSDYQKISELKALDTKLKAFYSATSKTIGYFFKTWWKEIIYAVLGTFLFLLITYRQISRSILKSKIKNLERRKESVRNLIAETQKLYFSKGSMSDTDYEIRTKKYAELIRDINRQIPLLKEELALKQRNKNETAGKKRK